jgi:hypothetical protein
MDTAKVIVRHIKSDGRFVIFELLAERIGETGEAALLHPKSKVLPLDVGRRDMARATNYPAFAYPYYLSRGIAPRGLYDTPLYAVVLFELAIGHVDAESVLDCAGVAGPAIGCCKNTRKFLR